MYREIFEIPFNILHSTMKSYDRTVEDPNDRDEKEGLGERRPKRRRSSTWTQANVSAQEPHVFSVVRGLWSGSRLSHENHDIKLNRCDRIRISVRPLGSPYRTLGAVRAKRTISS